jgi:hypothetical protein
MIPVLQTLKSAAKSKIAIFKLATAGLLASSNQDDDAALKRMRLQHPTSLTDRITRLVLLGALQKQVPIQCMEGQPCPCTDRG